jgi:hypothetical protein
VYGNEKENGRILTNKSVQLLKETYVDYVGLDMYKEWKKIECPKSIVYEF